MTASLVEELLKTKSQLKHNYERRLFVVGLSELLKADTLPESLRPLMLGLVQEVIDVMLKIRKTEAKERKRQERGSDSEKSDSEEDSDEAQLGDGQEELKGEESDDEVYGSEDEDEYCESMVRPIF